VGGFGTLVGPRGAFRGGAGEVGSSVSAGSGRKIRKWKSRVDGWRRRSQGSPVSRFALVETADLQLQSPYTAVYFHVFFLKKVAPHCSSKNTHLRACLECRNFIEIMQESCKNYVGIS
jgi:hypothetical protein